MLISCQKPGTFSSQKKFFDFSMGNKLKIALREFFRHDHPSGKTWKRRLGEAYIIYKFRSGRGDALLNIVTGTIEVAQKYGLVVLLIDRYFHWLAPVWVVAVVLVFKKIFQYFLGLWDFKHLGWWKFESDYSSRELNPWNSELMDRLKDVQTRIGEIEKENRAAGLRKDFFKQ